MEKGWTILIVLAVVVIAIVSSDNPGLQLAPGSFATQPGIIDTKNSLELQHCFEALELFDGTNVARVASLCGSLESEHAHAYAAENGLSSSGACSVNPRADVNGDGNIGFADVLAVLANWGPCSDCVEDVNEDGTVGFADILIILADWHKPICQCIDTVDNDNDGLPDAFDPGCWTDPSNEGTYDAMMDDESRATSECQDGVDNDNNTFIDWPDDTGCDSPQDYDESGGQTEDLCKDGIDNDNDGWIDFEDYGCIAGSEENVTGTTECSNQVDDADPEDTLVDGHDPDCINWEDNAESNLLPDLRIDRIQLWISPPDHKQIRVRVENSGDAPSPETIIAAEWEFRNESGDPVGENGMYEVQVPALEAGESTGYYFTEPIYEPRCGSVFIWGRIDPNNDIVESNENNNFRGSPQNLPC